MIKMRAVRSTLVGPVSQAIPQQANRCQACLRQQEWHASAHETAGYLMNFLCPLRGVIVLPYVYLYLYISVYHAFFAKSWIGQVDRKRYTRGDEKSRGQRGSRKTWTI